MFQWLTNVPIFLRLFIAFVLAAVIPDLVIIIVSSSYIQVLSAYKADSTQINSLLVGTFIAVFISTGVVTVLGFLVNRTITQRLLHLAALTKQISRGETDKRARVTGRDEISMVAVSMNTMLDDIVQLIQKTQGQRDSLQAQAEKLAHEVTGVSEGVLRSQMQKGTDALGAVANSFNYIVAELNNFIAYVKRNAGELEVSAADIFAQMTQLVENMEVQVQQAEISTSEAVQMSLSSQKVAEHVQSLDNTAKYAHQSVQAGRASALQVTEGIGRIHGNVRVTVSRIQQLGKRSREMDDIVRVITDIAQQTNRLALDVSLQAAMAGESGKKLTVVANDMRRVAEQTKEQTSMVNSLIQGVREDINAVAISLKETQRETVMGTTLVQGTGESLEKVFALVEQQVKEIEAIHSMVRNFLASVGDVTQVVQGVSLVTQQNSSSTRVTTQNIEHLVELVDQLLVCVEAFKIKTDKTHVNT
jgi:methyl-accepting chemotaxis protein